MPDETIKTLQDFQTAVIRKGLWQTCLNCDHWSNNSVERKAINSTEMCFHWKVRPPANVIVVGCSNWQDIVPF